MTKTKVVKIIGIIVIVVSIVYLIYVLKPILLHKEDLEFIELINSKAVTANVLIMTITTETQGDIITTSYSPGLSGAIFKKNTGSKGNKYYALTAFHGISLQSNAEIIVLTHNQQIYNDNVGIDMTSYYSRFPKATIEYYDANYDLAVISFVSDKEYSVLDIAKNPPEYKQPIAALGNPHGPDGQIRNSVTTGEITTREPVEFIDKENGVKLLHYVVEHSARTYPGSSGGAVLNKDMEIVGIHIGVGENIFGSFIRGMAVPSNKVLDFLNNWEERETINN